MWLDMVSLFPAKTFNNVQMGAAGFGANVGGLEAGFVRFPGGCVVEGGTIETAYNWKKTVGPLEQREEVWGPWNYGALMGWVCTSICSFVRT